MCTGYKNRKKKIRIFRAAAASWQERLSRARQTMYLIDIHMFYILLIMYYRVFVSACQFSALRFIFFVFSAPPGTTHEAVSYL